MDIFKTILEKYSEAVNNEAVIYSNSLIVHTKGIGLQKLLARVNGYENTTQYDLRKKFAISNKYVTSKLLRPVDNIWKSKGGSVHSDITEASK